MLMDGLAAEGVVLKVEEPGSPLNVGHTFRRGVLQAGKGLATGQRSLELADKLVKVVLYHTVEIDELSVDVVKYLYFSRR